MDHTNDNGEIDSSIMKDSKSEDSYSETDVEDSDFEIRHQSYSETEDSDSEIGSNSYQRKGSSRKKLLKTEPMSDYEKLLERNKAEKLALLKSLGIDEAKNDYSEAVNRNKKRNRTEKKTERPEVCVTRRASKRQKNVINYAEEKIKVSLQEMRLKYRPSEIPFKNVLKSERPYDSFIKSFSEEVEPDTIVAQTPMLYDKDVFEQLSVKAQTNNIPVPSAVSWYPSTDDLILAVGCPSGSVSFWNIKDTKFDLYTFSIHSKKVTNMQFNPCNPFHLISSSSDGTLFCCDMQKQIFTEVFRASDEGCTYFDFFSPSSYLVSLTNGQIVIVDKRTRGESRTYKQKRLTCHDFPITTINVHPVDNNYFVTAEAKRTVCVWDLRKFTEIPVIEISCHKKYVQSAFFSPVTGTSLLTTSRDDTVRIFDCTYMTNDGSMECYKTMKYTYMETRMRAVWLPNSDDTFVFSHKVNGTPKLQIYDKDLNVCGRVKNGIRGIRVLHTFHPFRCALASSSYSNNSFYVHT